MHFLRLASKYIFLLQVTVTTRGGFTVVVEPDVDALLVPLKIVVVLEAMLDILEL
jgi:hypothetical protein